MRRDAMARHPMMRGRLVVAAALAFSCGAFAQDDGRPQRQGDDAPPDVEAFEQAWRVIRDQFYDRTFHGADWEAARTKHLALAKQAKTRRELHEATLLMLGELKTSHTAIIEPDVYRELVEIESKGALAPTVGIDIMKLPEGYFVHDVIAGTPAAVSGVLRGDRLLHVDGATPEEAGLRPVPWDVGLGGPRGYYLPTKGKSILLELERRVETNKAGYNVYQVRLEPRPWSLLEAERASARVFERGPGLKIGYVRLYHFLSTNVVDLLASLLSDGPLAQTDGLILDIRGKGGLPEVVDRTIALFDKKTKHGPVYARPVVCVADSETRSAKEMFAWQWRQLAIGPLVGERTRGAVVGARFVPLPDGSYLVLASCDMRCCTGGTVLEGKGVDPDVQVTDKLAWASGADPLREKAEEILLENVLKAKRSGQHGWY
jgi:carboxyl-terminal processing protease